MSKIENGLDYQADKPNLDNINRRQFRDVDLNWKPQEWQFETPEGITISKPVYSVWNLNYWSEIASRLADGQRCAMQIAGAYGLGMIFEDPSLVPTPDSVVSSQFKKMEEVKRGRRPSQNFVVFINPEDQEKLMAVNKLNPKFQQLALLENRNNAHAWASHLIYPYNEAAKLDEALVKTADNSVALFWIKNHWAYEGIGREIAKIKKTGQLGGGSLNYHGELPSFNADELKAKIAARPDWQKNIDFILLDELVEKSKIERSQPMISFTGTEATLLRHGSMSIGEYMRRTGYYVVEPENVKYASSSTLYTTENNIIIDQKIRDTESLIADFKNEVIPSQK